MGGGGSSCCGPCWDKQHRQDDLFGDYQELGTKLKNRSPGVIISGLLPEQKVGSNGIKGEVARWVENWLGHRRQRVVVEGSFPAGGL